MGRRALKAHFGNSVQSLHRRCPVARIQLGQLINDIRHDRAFGTVGIESRPLKNPFDQALQTTRYANQVLPPKRAYNVGDANHAPIRWQPLCCEIKDGMKAAMIAWPVGPVPEELFRTLGEAAPTRQ